MGGPQKIYFFYLYLKNIVMKFFILLKYRGKVVQNSFLSSTKQKKFEIGPQSD